MVNSSALLEIFNNSLGFTERIKYLKSNNSFDDKSNCRTNQFDYVQFWKNNFNSDSLNYFGKRILWEGITVAELENLIKIQPELIVAGWQEILIKIVNETLLNKDKYNLSDILIIENEIAFQDYFVHIVYLAENELLLKLEKSGLYKKFTDKALNDLKCSLVVQLSDLCSTTLFFEFQKFRPNGSEFLSKFLKDKLDPGVNSRNAYGQFIANLHSDGGLSFFSKYPVLSKLISITTQNWINSNLLFIENIINDFDKLLVFFGITSSLDESVMVNRIEPNLSDNHNFGKSVYIVEFTDKTKIVYKPKSLEIDVSYNSFLEWINKQGFCPSLATMKTLNGFNDQYGYSQFIENTECKSESDVKDLFYKSGALLCVLHILRATDCHFENLIATASDLIFIDCETLLQPSANPAISNSLGSGSYPDYFNSVLRTDFLPIWKFDQSRKYAYDISGIGPINNENKFAKRLSWVNVNTDEMDLEFINVELSVSKNIPLFNNLPVNSNDYIENIKKGFTNMYNFFSTQKRQLVSNSSILRIFRNKKNRFIFRATEVYGFVLQEARKPEFLTNGLNHSIKLDILSRAHLWPDEKNSLWNIYESELNQAANLDIPYFNINTDSENLEVNGVSLKSYFRKSGYEEMMATIQNLSSDDLKNQIDVIEGTFIARNIIPNNTSRPEKVNYVFKKNNNNVFDINQLRNESVKIADTIIERSISDSDKITWRPLIIDIEANRFQYKPIGINLYNGKAGIALFMSALYFSTNNSKYRDFSLKCISEILSILSKPHSVEAIKGIGSIGIGAGEGIGSIIYALVKIGTFLDDKEIIQIAENAASLINEEMILKDSKLDIISGAAGCILSLLQLYQINNDKNVLELAKVCGDHLITKQSSYKNYPPAWQSSGKMPLTGFSHGAGGISYALLKLYEITYLSKYQEAAIFGIKYEQSQYDLEKALYPDYRDVENSKSGPLLNSWCNGFAGIILGRLGCLSVYSDKSILKEIQLGINSILKHDLRNVDHVCCGNFGRLESLLFYAINHDDKVIINEVKLRTASLIERANLRGSFLIHHDIPEKFISPGFFQGLSGVGYQLLRIAEPAKIPSVLLFE